MIFVTVGSQKFQFNRLLKAIDELVADRIITDSIFAQTGYSDYEPKNYEFRQFLDREEFTELTDKSSIVITHGGTGAIIGAVKKGKKVIAVPRRAEYGEHVDNHQFQLVGQFRDLNLIYECDDCAMLGKALEYVNKAEFNSYESSTQNIIDSIVQFLEG